MRAPSRIRTCDPLIRNQVRCPLRHQGWCPAGRSRTCRADGRAYPGRDSNAHCAGSGPAASCRWATRARCCVACRASPAGESRACPRRDSNAHRPGPRPGASAVGPRGHVPSGYRDSNPGPRRWQRRALPTELQPRDEPGAGWWPSALTGLRWSRSASPPGNSPGEPARGVHHPGARAARGHRTRFSGVEDRRVRRVHQDRKMVRRPYRDRTGDLLIESQASVPLLRRPWHPAGETLLPAGKSFMPSAVEFSNIRTTEHAGVVARAAGMEPAPYGSGGRRSTGSSYAHRETG